MGGYGPLRFLFCWEAGGNLGHLHTIRGAALELLKQHDVRCAVANVPAAVSLGLPNVLQAPIVRAMPFERFPVQCYADSIWGYGFDSPDHVAALVHSWRALFEAVNPDILVLNAAPGAALASRGHPKIGRMTLGTGYHVPVVGRPLFVANTERALRLLANVEQGAGVKLSDAAEIFSDMFHLFTTFPEFDHYDGRGDEGIVYVGPRFSLTQGERVQWRTNKLKVFVYARADLARFLLAHLEAANVEAIMCAPGFESATVGDIAAMPSIAFESAKGADVAITYGGHGSVAAMALQGIPQWVFPQYPEQMHTAQVVQSLGIGVCGMSPNVGASFRKQLEHVATLKPNVEAFTATHRDKVATDETIAGYLSGS